MAFEIIAANTPAHLDGIFKIRHKVYCEEEGYIAPRDNGRLIDRFDTFPTTTNLAVLYEGKVVGGMRLTLDSEMGIPEDDYYDFRRHIPKDSYVMGCGKNCVTKELREPKIARGLILMGIYFAVSHGVSHIVAAITPNIAKLLKRVGFQALDDEITIPDIRIPVIPALLDMRELKDYFRNFAIKSELYNFLKSYHGMFFSPSEQIIKTGEPGNADFIIIEGEVEVRYKDTILTNLSQGDVFGELALFTDDIRSADVWAKTEVKAMVLKKEAFLSHLKENPQQALKLTSTMANRLKSLINQIKTQNLGPAFGDVTPTIKSWGNAGSNSG